MNLSWAQTGIANMTKYCTCSCECVSLLLQSRNGVKHCVLCDCSQARNKAKTCNTLLAEGIRKTEKVHLSQASFFRGRKRKVQTWSKMLQENITQGKKDAHGRLDKVQRLQLSTQK